MYTTQIARTSFDDKERGSFAPGKIADMVILNRNPLELDPENLLSLKAEKLYLGGKEYRPGMGIAGMLLNTLFRRKEKI